eukprot:CAMPEP_0194759554 /NCGR_PEP_ID=MMETSP0323_2-20130528/12595_1 /TAXON_ID=2866 ORGANISM="Crypthecodinium cohnii, Strain Seligo" /NCGR_SAMPLE_ID=MMETSP0323_2 /ASSEMBLY_ACC=CAM_ASM_000346 /LENGTH=108 /DNA_ID=CAMNT_0039680351 /DNA_START=174 /DNA_END=497 /DNA_ORIENTATION=-
MHSQPPRDWGYLSGWLMKNQPLPSTTTFTLLILANCIVMFRARLLLGVVGKTFPTPSHCAQSPEPTTHSLGVTPELSQHVGQPHGSRPKLRADFFGFGTMEDVALTWA